MDNARFKMIFCEHFNEKSDKWNLAAHSHDYYEFIYFLEGKADIKTGGNSLHISLYDVVVYPPGAMHKESVNLGAAQDIICIGIKANEKLFEADAPFMLSDDGELKAFFERIHGEYKHFGSTPLLYHYIGVLTELIGRNAKRTVRHGFSQTVSAYIENHFHERIDLKHLAKIANVSVSYLIRKFKEETGFTPNAYKIHLQVESAKRFLKSGKYNIEEIAQFTGFSSPSYFWRVFKNKTGKSPKTLKNTGEH